MSNSFTLDDIRAAADAKYGSTDITIGEKTVRLLNPLRLTKEKRESLTSLQTQLDDDGNTEARDQETVLADTIRLVAEVPAMAEFLLKEVNGDLAVLASILEAYGKGTQVGEA